MTFLSEPRYAHLFKPLPPRRVRRMRWRRLAVTLILVAVVGFCGVAVITALVARAWGGWL